MRRAALAAGAVALVGASLRREETASPEPGHLGPEPHANETQPATAADPRYKCDMCGHIYSPEEGIPAGSGFDDLPDTWTCPVCGSTKQMYFLVNTSQGERWVHSHSPGPTPASGTLELPAVTSFAEIASASGTRWHGRDDDDGDRDPSHEKWKYPTKFGPRTGKWLMRHLQKEKSDLRKHKDTDVFFKLHPDTAKLQMRFINGLQKMAKTYNTLVANVASDTKSVQRWQKTKEHADWYDRVDETALRGDFDRVENLAAEHPDVFQQEYGNKKLDWPPIGNVMRTDSQGNEYSEDNEDSEDN